MCVSIGRYGRDVDYRYKTLLWLMGATSATPTLWSGDVIYAIRKLGNMMGVINHINAERAARNSQNEAK